MSRAMVTTGGTLRLDDGTELHVEEVIDVAPEYTYVEASEPDPGWVGTDAHGHRHRWLFQGERPGEWRTGAVVPTATRTVRRVECDGTCPDGDCTGYPETVFRCNACHEEIQPGSRRTTVPMQETAGYRTLTVVEKPVGRVTIGDGRPVALPATLEWPAGPGQTLRVTGRAYRSPEHTTEFVGGGSGPVTRRTYRFEADADQAGS